jgi:hypothetical protein
VDPSVCETSQYPEFNSVQYLAVSAVKDLRLPTPTVDEPGLYCRHRATCRNARLRGALLTAPRYNIWRDTVVVQIRAVGSGWVKVRVGDDSGKRRVDPGQATVLIERPEKRKRLKVLTRPRYFTAYGTEARRWISARKA